MDTYPERKNHRLKAYDYTQAGYYFITICAHHRRLLFGDIIHKSVGSQRAVTVNLNVYGKIVDAEWQYTQRLRENIQLDEYIIMPNHFHGIIQIQNTVSVPVTARRDPTTRFGKPVSGGLSSIIRSFKSAVTKRINELRNSTTPPVWQPSFYDHVIRTDTSLYNIREYTRNNPRNWDSDKENPKYNNPAN